MQLLQVAAAEAAARRGQRLQDGAGLWRGQIRVALYKFSVYYYDDWEKHLSLQTFHQQTLLSTRLYHMISTQRICSFHQLIDNYVIIHVLHISTQQL